MITYNLGRFIQMVVFMLWIIGSSSCGGSATAPSVPAPPNSPQTQALNLTKTLADSISAAVNTAIQLRNAGTVSAADTTAIENWAHSADLLDKQIVTELANAADPWPVQKAKILVLLPGFQIPLRGTTATTLQAALAAVSSTVALLRAQVQ